MYSLIHLYVCLLTDSCTFKLEKEHLKVSQLFPLLNSKKSELGILDWGVKMTTLEDGEWNNSLPSFTLSLS